MKKSIALLLVVILTAALFAGCNSNNAGTTTTTAGATTAAPTTAAPTTPTATTVKTGLAISTSVGKSADPTADKAGLVQADSTIVAVTVDADGKIVSCVIDAAQTKANFDTAGKVTTPLDSAFKTKNELGAEYGMIKGSKIGKEWNEQAAALAQYVIGKTVDEVKGIAIDAEGKATDADLSASVTVSLGGFIETIAKAVENAADLGASATDKLSLGTVTNISGSKDAAADAAGLVQVYSTYTAVTTDTNGVITSCMIDATQSKVNFDATGKITTDLTAAVATKNELGEGYGLKIKSGIGKEWNEQAAAFAAYVTGKTPADVQGIAVSEGTPTAADLTASVTIHITDFQAAIANAAK